MHGLAMYACVWLRAKEIEDQRYSIWHRKDFAKDSFCLKKLPTCFFEPLWIILKENTFKIMLFVIRWWHRHPYSWHKDCDTEREGDGTEQRCSWKQGHINAVSQTGRIYSRHSLPESVGFTKV